MLFFLILYLLSVKVISTFNLHRTIIASNNEAQWYFPKAD